MGSHGEHKIATNDFSKTHTTADYDGTSSASEADNEKLERLEMERTNTDALASDEKIYRAETFMTNNDNFRPHQYQDGELVKIPAASRDPRDPLNLQMWHKVLGLGCLSFFGALIASAELILGAALPVFALEYSTIPGIGPKIFKTLKGFPVGSNPLDALEELGGPPIFQIYLLATMPVLMIGVSNLALVPLAIAVGRRPVILGAGILGIVGAIWAGFSQSLGSHIGARCVQAIGAGSVESLIPFIIQDVVHVHERNTWISAAFACQGVVIIALGFSAPYLILNLSWRWLYHITAIAGAFFLVGVFFFMPETRWSRTRGEMNGIPRDDENVEYTPRTTAYNLRFWNKTYFGKGWTAFLDTMRTFFYPSILFVTMLNGSVIASAFAAGFTAAPALLTAPWSWPFYHLGLCLVAVLVAAILVPLVTGALADWAANAVAKRRGARVPENQLINLFLPWACSLVGALVFGISGNDQSKYPWIAFLIALGLMAFGFLGISTTTTVYVLESYPHMAGPALVNVASFRWILAFFLTLYASDWIVDLRYQNTFLIYTGLIAFFGLFIPVVYLFGPQLRKRFPGPQRASEMPAVAH